MFLVLTGELVKVRNGFYDLGGKRREMAGWPPRAREGLILFTGFHGPSTLLPLPLQPSSSPGSGVPSSELNERQAVRGTDTQPGNTARRRKEEAEKEESLKELRAGAEAKFQKPVSYLYLLLNSASPV